MIGTCVSLDIEDLFWAFMARMGKNSEAYGQRLPRVFRSWIPWHEAEHGSTLLGVTNRSRSSTRIRTRPPCAACS